MPFDSVLSRLPIEVAALLCPRCFSDLSDIPPVYALEEASKEAALEIVGVI
jgi:hypothetical protein